MAAAAVASAASLGIVLHQVFQRFEPTYIRAIWTLAGANVALYGLLQRLEALPTGLTRSALLGLIGCISIGSLLLSIGVYRLSPWHPLARFPGSTSFKLTKLRTVFASWRGDYFKRVKQMHDKYGPVVRVAPNAVSINDVSAVAAVLGANGLPKDRYYRARVPAPGAGSLIVLAGNDHAHRRKLWNRGLGKDALATHSQTAAAGIDKLRFQFDKVAKEGGAIDLTMWLRFYGFDFMGKFAFDRDFGLIDSGRDSRGVWAAVAKFMIAVDIIAHLHWLGKRAMYLPWLLNSLAGMRNFATSCVQDRLQRPATKLDLWYYLGMEDEDSTDRLSVPQLAAEGVLAIIAGADTSASAMTVIIYFLLRNRECFAKAREEVDNLVASGLTPWTNPDCHDALPYLTACMNETLRIAPVVPTNGSRGVPVGSGGKVICGHFIPEDTEVFVSPYMLHHDPRNFSPETESFRPQRWLGEPGWNTNRLAFIPFSAGPAQCVGKNLARIEILMVLSALLRFYDIAFAPGSHPETWLEHVEEHLVIDLPPLPVILKRRAL
ncbi:cytochrome P450 [Auricularia subglabra TFB-10046 SS5]|nr:cytochrome P450 [Auricularia subglabra TFB-10046 SS5]